MIFYSIECMKAMSLTSIYMSTYCKQRQIGKELWGINTNSRCSSKENKPDIRKATNAIAH